MEEVMFENIDLQNTSVPQNDEFDEMMYDIEQLFEDDEVKELSKALGRKYIESMDEAIRLAYALSEIHKEIKQVNALADEEIGKWQEKIKQVEEWRDQQIKKLERIQNNIQFLLIQYHREQYEKAPEKVKKRLKSIKLPYGVTLKSVQPQVSFEIVNEDKYKQYMLENNFYEIPEPKLKWGEAKKQFKVIEDEEGNLRVIDSNGEFIDFVKVNIKEREYSVKIED